MVWKEEGWVSGWKQKSRGAREGGRGAKNFMLH
jgi:hypothetical protein